MFSSLELIKATRPDEEDNRASSCLGGILADAMGLGKTLTMLASIASTANSAREFAEATICEGELIRAMGTLVVVTSRRECSGHDSVHGGRFANLLDYFQRFWMCGTRK